MESNEFGYKLNHYMLNNIHSQLSTIPPLHFTPTIMKIDSGASGTYVRYQDKHLLPNSKPISNGPSVVLPDSTSISPTDSGHLNIPGLSKTATKSYLFPDLHSASLLSVGQLCDDGCDVTFRKTDVTAHKNGTVVLQGYRNYNDKLWDIPFNKQGQHILPPSLPPPTTFHQQFANVIIPKDLSTAQLIEFYQACLFSPAKSTLLKAVKNGNFITWPSLSVENVNKYYKQTIYCAKGHLNQERQNTQSTKLFQQKQPSLYDTQILLEDHFPTMETGHKTRNVLCNLQPFQARETGYSDLSGRFPFASTRGSEYVLVMYDYDSNAILATAVKNRQAATLKDAFIELYSRLKYTGNAPTFFILDNECSNELKKSIEEE